MKRLVIGTRGSKLARTQTEWVADRLRKAHKTLAIEIKVVRTTGDRDQSTPLPAIGSKGLFTQELDQELLDGKIDCAVHSMKDLPTDLPDGITILAVPDREQPHDVLISREGLRFLELPRGATVGTGSIRRRAQLRCIRDDLEYADIRGNVDTRITKLTHGDYQAIILAAAGLRRLGLEEQITEMFEPSVVLPAVGQGALAITGRKGDKTTRDTLRPIGDLNTRRSVTSERAFLSVLGGGCHVPIAAHARVTGRQLQLEGLVIAPDGTARVRDRITGPAKDAAMLGVQLGERLLKLGAGSILQSLNQT
ncbi:MAG: hydroxymethylbilane synthase [Planctomycetes bacterium]|nr:hydroxymethylbilane synthase [Planctomycetota bacterium]